MLPRRYIGLLASQMLPQIPNVERFIESFLSHGRDQGAVRGLLAPFPNMSSSGAKQLSDISWWHPFYSIYPILVYSSPGTCASDHDFQDYSRGRTGFQQVQ
jgi:hypothetical protein